jgi:hypothetical protein
MPDEGPALRNYQEAGQLSGYCLNHCGKMIFVEKAQISDSKTGRWFCTKVRQKPKFACFLSAIEAKV